MLSVACKAKDLGEKLEEVARAEEQEAARVEIHRQLRELTSRNDPVTYRLVEVTP